MDYLMDYDDAKSINSELNGDKTILIIDHSMYITKHMKSNLEIYFVNVEVCYLFLLVSTHTKNSTSKIKN
jgi:NADH:ubiquinone oxidoreductase subunit F (NADH-binding)